MIGVGARCPLTSPRLRQGNRIWSARGSGIGTGAPSPACGGGLGWGYLRVGIVADCGECPCVARALTRHALRARRPLPQAGEAEQARTIFVKPICDCPVARGKRSDRSCDPGEEVQVYRRSHVWREAPHPNSLPVRTGRGSVPSLRSQSREIISLLKARRSVDTTCGEIAGWWHDPTSAIVGRLTIEPETSAYEPHCADRA
ncbi:hypothetical protein V1280_005599 [Bradyrhizobium sp. AZCC 2230]